MSYSVLRDSVHPAEFQRCGADCFFKYSDEVAGISKAGMPGDVLYPQAGTGDQEFFCLAQSERGQVFIG